MCKKNIPIILLGNKTDITKERKIQPEEGVQLALSEKIKFKETSCLKNENVADAFEALIELWNLEVLKQNIFEKNRIPSLEIRRSKEEVLSKTKTLNEEDDKIIAEKLEKSLILTKDNNLGKKNIDNKCCLSSKKNKSL